MNKKMKTILAAAVLMLGTVAAMPADLKNEDGKRYEVKVHDGGTTRNTWIDGNSTVLSICSSCEIEVVGIGKMRVSGSDKLIIKNGKLSK
ncbi:MAG: hypothetical protein KF831_13585 [Acidobacteria bacterium]|nr:hypothetical protein [Acidobacteriota bacterium]HCA57129.1 hypothetical protein [Blastocatellia bacterium]